MDNKASIKIDFNIYWKNFKTEMWINYDTNGFDKRIEEWFRESFEDAAANYLINISED